VNKSSFGWWLALALAMTFIVVVALGVVTYHNTSVLLSTDRLVADSYRAREVAESLLSSLKEAETSQRDYLIYGDEKFLKPVHESSDQVKAKLVELRGITPESADLDKQLDTLERLAVTAIAQSSRCGSNFPATRAFRRPKREYWAIAKRR
jgi:CHASE3 domain sensor protein